MIRSKRNGRVFNLGANGLSSPQNHLNAGLNDISGP